MNEIEEKTLESFLEQYPKSNTKRAYRAAVFDFLDFFNNARIRKGKQATKEERKQYEVVCQKYFSEGRKHINDLIGFVVSMAGKPPKTVKLKVAACKEWLSFNDVELSQKELKSLRKKMPRAKGAWSVESDFDLISLRKLLSHADEKGTALICMLASSGMRIGEALTVSLKDVDLTKAPPEIVIRGEHTKTEETRVVFISTEAKTALEEWLQVRDGYLKSAQNRNRGLITKGGAKPKNATDDRLFPFSDATVREMWGRILTKAGFSDKDSSTGRLQYRIHGLRKFFRSQLALTCPVDIVEDIMGHEGYLTGSYRRYPHKQKAEYYLQAEHHVTIMGSGDIKEIRDKLQDTTAAVAGYKVIFDTQQEELAALKEKIDAMEVREAARQPYDDKMTRILERLLSDPQTKELIKRELGH